MYQFQFVQYNYQMKQWIDVTHRTTVCLSVYDYCKEYCILRNYVTSQLKTRNHRQSSPSTNNVKSSKSQGSLRSFCIFRKIILLALYIYVSSVIDLNVTFDAENTCN